MPTSAAPSRSATATRLGVDPTEAEIRVRVDQLGDPLPVRRREDFDSKVAGDDRAVEVGFGAGPELAIDQPTCLRHHEGCRDEGPGMTLQEGLTAIVVGISVIGRGQDDVGVDQEGQRPNPSASISSSSLARRSLVERPRLTNPSLRRGGNCSAKIWAARASGATPRWVAATATRTASASSTSTVSFVVISISVRTRLGVRRRPTVAPLSTGDARGRPGHPTEKERHVLLVGGAVRE